MSTTCMATKCSGVNIGSFMTRSPTKTLGNVAINKINMINPSVIAIFHGLPYFGF